MLKPPKKPSLTELVELCKGKSGKTGDAEVAVNWTKKEAVLFASSLSVVARLIERNADVVKSYEVSWVPTRNKSGDQTGFELGQVELVLDKKKIRAPETLVQRNAKTVVPPALAAIAEKCDKKSGDEFAEGGIELIRGSNTVTFETWIPHHAAKLIRRNAEAIVDYGILQDTDEDGKGSFGIYFKLKADCVRGFEYIATTGTVRSPRALPEGFGRKKKVDYDEDEL